MADNTVRGRFVWHELITPNGAGAHEFYGKTIGWSKQSWEQDPSYQMFTASSGPLGATVEKRDAVPQWLAYIGSTDVDATVEAATRLGATVTTPATTLPNAGRYAVLSDPNGATFGVHGSPDEPRPETDPQEGEFCWHEVATTVDPVDAFAFYKELFGWEKGESMDMGPMGTYQIFNIGSTQIGGIMNKPNEMPVPAWAYYFNVGNIDEAAGRVKSAGGKVMQEPTEVPGGGWIIQAIDPQGARFALFGNR